MEVVLVISHLTGNEVIDRRRMEEYCRYAVCKRKIPISPYLCLTESPAVSCRTFLYPALQRRQ